jgi:hypothetical protein
MVCGAAADCSQGHESAGVVRYLAARSRYAKPPAPARFDRLAASGSCAVSFSRRRRPEFPQRRPRQGAVRDARLFPFCGFRARDDHRIC